MKRQKARGGRGEGGGNAFRDRWRVANWGGGMGSDEV